LVCAAFRLGNAVYQSSEDCLRSIQAILYSYEVGQVLAPPDHDALMAVLNCHPRRDAKVGPGVDHFTVDEAGEDVYQKRVRFFVVVRTDGTRDDFSYRKCLLSATAAAKQDRRVKAQPQPAATNRYLREEIVAALKRAVADQVRCTRSNALWSVVLLSSDVFVLTVKTDG
jgi:hypothetical protein